MVGENPHRRDGRDGRVLCLLRRLCGKQTQPRTLSPDRAGSAWPPVLGIAILALFLALAGLYNAIVPVYEAPDELEHTAFIVWLADGGGLPVVDPQHPGPWAQEGTQPPLYYWLIARLLGRLPHPGAGNLARPNPYAGLGDPQRPDNKNRVLHDPMQERWPYRGDALFVHTARAVSTLMALGTLLAVYRLGRIALPQRPGVAVGMTGLVAFLPQFLFLSASINNDNLVILVAAWVLVILTGWLRAPRLPGWPAVAGLGALLGLGVLSKYGGLLLWPLAGGVLAWLAWRTRRLRWLLPAGFLALGLALAVCGWWFIRNQRLYGDLSGLGVHLAIMGTRRKLPSLVKAWREFNGFRYSFWALFGWFNILVPELFYRLMDILTGMGAIGLALLLARTLRRRRLPAWGVMLLTWLGLVAAGVLRWTTLTPASQGRLLYPALPAIALSLVAGWAEILPRRWRWPVGHIALVGWATWAGLCPFLFIRPAYALPPRIQGVDMAGLAGPQVRFGDCCELVGYRLPDGPFHPGDRVPLTLVWRVLASTEQDYSLFVHVVTDEGKRVGQLDTYHGGGSYPTSLWQPGEVIVDTAYVPISWRAEGPALVRFQIGLHGPDAVRLPAFASDGQELEVVFAGEAELRPPAPSPP